MQGIEGWHSWYEIDGIALLFEMNRPDTWPRIKVRDIAGLFDLPDSEDNSEDNTEAIGAEPLPSYVRTKNVTYTVDVFGRTAQEMRQGTWALRQAFGANRFTGLNPIRRMVVRPNPEFPGDLDQYTFSGRCLQCSPGGDVQERGANAVPSPFGRNYVIGIKLYDPRIYRWPLSLDPAGVMW